MNDLLPKRIAEALRTDYIGRSLTVLGETGSTNDDARAALASGAPSGHVVVADRQRHGRGARGAVWESPAGTDLYLSIGMRLDIPPAELPPLTLAVGMGVATTVARHVEPARVRIKWPNDVLVDGLKCAGILVETSSVGQLTDSVVIGVGLDVNRRDFGPLASIATSLAQCGRCELNRTTLLVSLLGDIEQEVDRFVQEGSASVARRIDPRLAWRGAEVRCDEVQGVLLGVATDGSLRLETPNGVRHVRAGTLRLA